MVPATGTGAEMGGAAMTWQPDLADWVVANVIRPAPKGKNAKPTQAKRILRYLQAGHRLTPMDALEQFGCFRLAARIHELRREGWNIIERTVETASGKRIAEYSL
jgi:hypothetical protein